MVERVQCSTSSFSESVFCLFAQKVCVQPLLTQLKHSRWKENGGVDPARVMSHLITPSMTSHYPIHGLVFPSGRWWSQCRVSAGLDHDGFVDFFMYLRFMIIVQRGLYLHRYVNS